MPGAANARGQTLRRYVESAPSPENAAAIFAGEWASRFPPPFEHLTSGSSPVFEDDRIKWVLGELGDIHGWKLLELGPLEGGHSYMLDRAGASVTSIEANTSAFLKCLITKELLGMPGVRFLCGDFTAFLRESSEQFDLAIASGVLYHMVNPVELIELLSRVTRRLFLWTHFYDEAIIESRPELADRFQPATTFEHSGFSHHLYQYNYGSSLAAAGFCGGSRPFSYWLSRHDIERALTYFGFSRQRVAQVQPDHLHGPAFSLLAERP